MRILAQGARKAVRRAFHHFQCNCFQIGHDLQPELPQPGYWSATSTMAELGEPRLCIEAKDFAGCRGGDRAGCSTPRVGELSDQVPKRVVANRGWHDRRRRALVSCAGALGPDGADPLGLDTLAGTASADGRGGTTFDACTSLEFVK